jgi:hypothetical protein
MVGRQATLVNDCSIRSWGFKGVATPIKRLAVALRTAVITLGIPVSDFIKFAD